MEKVRWVNSWDDAGRGRENYGGISGDEPWTRYWNAISDEYLKEFGADERFYHGIIDYLRGESMFREGYAVLDIGCGPGNYSLLFAEDAMRVDALDSAGQMLEALKCEAAKRRLSNVRAIRSKWEDFHADKAYELVFSSMSPAIRDKKTLLKMEDCSRSGCCLITYGDVHEYPAIRDLWGEVVGEYASSNHYLYTYPYRLLCDINRHPSLKIFEYDYGCHPLPVDVAAKHYTVFFNIFTSMDSEKIKKVNEYFNANSTGGYYEKKTRMKLAVISWTVGVT